LIEIPPVDFLQPCGHCMAPARYSRPFIVLGLYFQWRRGLEECISAWPLAAQSVAMQQASLVFFLVIYKLTSVDCPLR
jgi:hypothetical protein